MNEIQHVQVPWIHIYFYLVLSVTSEQGCFQQISWDGVQTLQDVKSNKLTFDFCLTFLTYLFTVHEI